MVAIGWSLLFSQSLDKAQQMGKWAKADKVIKVLNDL